MRLYLGSLILVKATFFALLFLLLPLSAIEPTLSCAHDSTAYGIAFTRGKWRLFKCVAGQVPEAGESLDFFVGKEGGEDVSLVGAFNNRIIIQSKAELPFATEVSLRNVPFSDLALSNDNTVPEADKVFTSLKPVEVPQSFIPAKILLHMITRETMRSKATWWAIGSTGDETVDVAVSRAGSLKYWQLRIVDWHAIRDTAGYEVVSKHEGQMPFGGRFRLVRDSEGTRSILSPEGTLHRVSFDGESLSCGSAIVTQAANSLLNRIGQPTLALRAKDGGRVHLRTFPDGNEAANPWGITESFLERLTHK